MGTLKKTQARWTRWHWWAKWRRTRDRGQDLADMGTAFALDLSLAGRPRRHDGAADPSDSASVREGSAPLL